MKTKRPNFTNFIQNPMRIFLWLVLSAYFLSGCSSPLQENTKSIQSSFVAFDTIISVTLYGTDDEQLLQQVQKMCTDYENLFSRTIPDSDVYRINHAGGGTVEVDPETLLLIKEALSYSRLTEGAVDITIAPVKDLWNFSSLDQTADIRSLPDPAALEEALSHVDYHCVQYDETSCTVTLTDPEAQIDLGFIAKGYIADVLKEYLISKGITRGILNLGGNVLTIGSKPDETPFLVGIEKPFETSEVMEILSINDQSVVTSGIYERYFAIDDKVYHHILDPQTGYPVSNDLLSVTIISDSSMEGDALSTSCLLLGFSKAQELIEGLEDIEAVFITEDYEVHKTTGL